MFSALISAAVLATLAVGLPAPFHKRTEGYSTFVEIHSSCNATQRRMLEKGLNETFEVAAFAHDYIHKHGASDPVFQLYFGNKPEAYPSAVGVYDAILNSDKTGVLFRCDDPDKNCAQPGWRGHYRGENATSETVICDASYTDRLYNAAFCMYGYELATQAPSTYWSIDLMHRLFHVPAVTGSSVNHYADNLDEALELAIHNSTFSPFDSDAVQYFAAHVYALEVAQGGQKCIGNIAPHNESHSDSTSFAAPVPTSTALAAPTTHAAPTTTTEAPVATASSKPPADCHSHADGTVHCV